MAPPWLGPAIEGIAAVGGSIISNRMNVGLSREQMRFQERMRDTAVQSAVRDYRAAGLNPALAYDRSSAAPGGASTTMGDPVSAGLSNARAARDQQLARQMAYETMRKTRSETQINQVEAANRIQQGNLLRQQLLFNAALQPHTLRNISLENQLKDYTAVGAKNQAEFERFMEEAKKGSTSAATMARLFQLFRSIQK